MERGSFWRKAWEVTKTSVKIGGVVGVVGACSLGNEGLVNTAGGVPTLPSTNHETFEESATLEPYPTVLPINQAEPPTPTPHPTIPPVPECIAVHGSVIDTMRVLNSTGSMFDKYTFRRSNGAPFIDFTADQIDPTSPNFDAELANDLSRASTSDILCEDAD